MDLDDVAALSAADPGDMLGAAAGLATHCREGYEAGLRAAAPPAAEGVGAIAFCGMGGSGVSGDVLRALYRSRLGQPIDVVKGPELPAHSGPHTLVLACSYSGGTAETIACFEEAVARGCRLVAVTSGGDLARRAQEVGAGLVLVPPGFQPRAALGYLALGSIGALEAVGLAPSSAGDLDEAVAVLEGLAERLAPAVAAPDNPAKALAAAIGERVPVVWGAEGLGAVAAARWKTQFNENAKVPAFASALPELDHNEVVGWSGRRGDGFAVISLRLGDEPPEVALRFEPSAAIAAASGALHDDVRAAGTSPLARFLSLVTIGDFASTYLAIARGVDPTPVEAITRLKAVLAGDR